jgi:molecular chaperone DnaK (HSP70)|eukprot:COSAG04_NODE_442_length_14382_cov_72.823566_3_plen_84_part_00
MVEEAEKFKEEDARFTERLEARSAVEKLAYNLLEMGREYEIEQLETKAKEVREWCDAVGLTATKVDYQKKRVELEELMAALGL